MQVKEEEIEAKKNKIEQVQAELDELETSMTEALTECKTLLAKKRHKKRLWKQQAQQKEQQLQSYGQETERKLAVIQQCMRRLDRIGEFFASDSVLTHSGESGAQSSSTTVGQNGAPTAARVQEMATQLTARKQALQASVNEAAKVPRQHLALICKNWASFAWVICTGSCCLITDVISHC